MAKFLWCEAVSLINMQKITDGKSWRTVMASDGGILLVIRGYFDREGKGGDDWRATYSTNQSRTRELPVSLRSNLRRRRWPTALLA